MRIRVARDDYQVWLERTDFDPNGLLLPRVTEPWREYLPEAGSVVAEFAYDGPAATVGSCARVHVVRRMAPESKGPRSMECAHNPPTPARIRQILTSTGPLANLVAYSLIGRRPQLICRRPPGRTTACHERGRSHVTSVPFARPYVPSRLRAFFLNLRLAFRRSLLLFLFHFCKGCQTDPAHLGNLSLLWFLRPPAGYAKRTRSAAARCYGAPVGAPCPCASSPPVPRSLLLFPVPRSRLSSSRSPVSFLRRVPKRRCALGNLGILRPPEDARTNPTCRPNSSRCSLWALRVPVVSQSCGFPTSSRSHSPLAIRHSYRRGQVAHAVEIDAYLQATGIDRADYFRRLDGGRNAELLKPARAWRLLLQLDTDYNAKMMWGDCAKLYFMIREAALAAERFEDCVLVLQCTRIEIMRKDE